MTEHFQEEREPNTIEVNLFQEPRNLLAAEDYQV
jgi:hypothetical protein